MTTNQSGTFRNTTDPFTMVQNTVIEDKNLSLKAKGLYLIIKHYITIPNFKLNKGYLITLSKEGERAFDSTWKELKDAGYLKQHRLKGKGGKWIYEYELLHEPIIEEDKKEIKEVKEKQEKPATSPKVEDYNKKIKTLTNNNTPKQEKDTYKKTKFHNFDETFTNYSAEELEKIAIEQQDKFDSKKGTVKFTEADLRVMAINELREETELNVIDDNFWNDDINRKVNEIKGR